MQCAMAIGKCALSLAAVGRHVAGSVLSGSGNPNFPVIYLRPCCHHGKVRSRATICGDAEGIVEKHPLMPPIFCFIRVIIAGR